MPLKPTHVNQTKLVKPNVLWPSNTFNSKLNRIPISSDRLRMNRVRVHSIPIQTKYAQVKIP